MIIQCFVFLILFSQFYIKSYLSELAGIVGRKIEEEKEITTRRTINNNNEVLGRDKKKTV